MIFVMRGGAEIQGFPEMAAWTLQGTEKNI